MDKASIPCPLYSKVNQGAGYGLEIPCVYQFYGPKPYIDKLPEVVDSLKTSGLV